MRRALITGASRGLGREVALLLAEAGIALTLVGREEGALKELTNQLVKKSETTYLISDLSKPDSLAVVENLIDKGSFDLIINNAGFGLYGKAIDIPLSEQLEMIEVNVKALVSLSIRGVRAMVAAGRRGVILNISSAAGFVPTPLMTIYGATKAFVTSFSQGLDFECRKSGVRVLVSCPGMISTDFAKRAAKNDSLVKEGHSMSVQRAAKEILWQIHRQKKVYVFDGKTRWLMRIATHLPHSFAKHWVFRSIKKRI